MHISSIHLYHFNCIFIIIYYYIARKPLVHRQRIYHAGNFAHTTVVIVVYRTAVLALKTCSTAILAVFSYCYCCICTAAIHNYCNGYMLSNSSIFRSAINHHCRLY
ncbi:hypothetical protein BDF19DRAFT_436215 [Syncephalis fuscata]|nr:hypothetical protein BDF19DRAFT_436215 [Syncephalis fuscata]